MPEQVERACLIYSRLDDLTPVIFVATGGVKPKTS
jgi:hypothetical protein